MQKFGYRSPRFAVNLPVTYTMSDITAAGRCLEISQDGMTLEVKQPLEMDAVGTVSLSYKNQALELDVRAVHESGMEFLYKSEMERNAVTHLIGLLTAAKSARGPVLLS